MKIGIKQSNEVWRAYTQSNWTLDITNDHYQLTLYDTNGEEIMPIQKSLDMDEVKLDLERFSQQLGTGVI
ncbi:hypothetical protein BFP97_01495 [Roseivirga sp. 4D4]|uniref:hypothetical protein n=1 Tax=Roseivirga sp. 4D4 TaxID=1889784 RepID=UPI000853BA5D|nr:hypothetical protein [Roseivirga sp. 4D4]OEK00265.1 hypothetical protein BFP97_01495 [Roseivirga sp. 4D4]